MKAEDQVSNVDRNWPARSNDLKVITCQFEEENPAQLVLRRLYLENSCIFVFF